MKCSKCSHEIREGDRFCGSCGQPVPEAVPSEPVAVFPAEAPKSKKPVDQEAVRKKGLKVLGCLGVAFLIGVVLCGTILPLHMKWVWSEAEKFKETTIPNTETNRTSMADEREAK